MKVLMLNGSPHIKGCTYTALAEVASALSKEGVESTIVNVGQEPVHGCMACRQCRRTGFCVHDDVVNRLIPMLADHDALVVGSPVYYSGPSGALCCVLDRLFYAASGKLAYKPGAAVCSARRAGTTATLERLNQYFLINNMPVIGSDYWNMVHGNTPAEVRQDEEGMHVMRNLGQNLGWMLRLMESGKANGVQRTLHEPAVSTNFIR